MTPLNSISTNSFLVKWKVARNYSYLENVNKDVNFDLFMQDHIDEDKMLSKLSVEANDLYSKILNIEQSA